MKQCSRCGGEFPATRAYFITHSDKPLGLGYWCRTCERQYQKERRAKNPEAERNRSRKQYEQLRAEVLSHYGKGSPKCECCGEPHIEFLSIDHINGKGNEHREEVGRGCNFLRWLIYNDFPKDFRILCHNCNQSLGSRGYCPHQRIGLTLAGD